MHKEGKVVPLATTLDRGARAPSPCLPVLLLQVRDKAALQLRQGLQALFDNADDTLFEMADKASGRLDQNLYFEAMRDVRLKRKSIERGFLDTFYDAFARIGQCDALASLVSAQLAQQDPALERSVAVQAMVDRVLSRDGFLLEQLSLRFETLLELTIELPRNPLGPGSLCGFFLQAGRDLGVGPNVKLVLLKLFERYVLRDLDLLYGEANLLLASAGVLPELMPAPRRRAEDRRHIARRAPSSSALHESDADSAGQAFFCSLQALLEPSRGRVAPRLQTTRAAQPISTDDLLRLLTHLQHYVPAPGEPDDFKLGQQLEQLLLRVSVRSGTRRRIATADEDMINLVELLFAFIQADDNLPASLRALIGRLHIPLLKVALIDKGLLSRGSHPARRLLNEIAAVAIGWDSEGDEQRDSLHLRVERIVQRLLNDFSEDCGLFSELLDEFLSFSQDERRRNELLEQRTRDAEEGRARTLLARERVQQVLNLRLRGQVLPQVVVQMLVQAWSQVLLLAWLKQGEDSQAWAQGVATMDGLLGSLVPTADPARLLEQVPGLLKALREGLAGVALDSTATRDFFLQLEKLHLRACGGVLEPEQALAEVRVEDDIVLAIADESTHVPCSPVDDQEPALRQVERLRLGSWVEVMDDDEPLRCKLVARIDSHDRFVFANRTGLKVREWSRHGLAVALRRGEVRLLDDGLLFERALDAVLEQLRLQQAR
ncbi:DUF1631 domain-containing protein [Pseudomonas xantholysinigenes]|uniref:DUF1631 domain-containing protein n=1 Tax=Pseudomonas xantholysinigenes TaxID=2745490 RepID=A0A9E6TVX4_9PSED|nr:DUF1631 domain-containing protein [Pseudomonas xantholysinigenes]QXI37733.1 DUF1631 domain-containing protein [Pseudomonas xantholysinigenes]